MTSCTYCGGDDHGPNQCSDQPPAAPVETATGDVLATLVLEYARDLRRNSSGGDDYPWEYAKGTADHLEELVRRCNGATAPVETEELLSRLVDWAYLHALEGEAWPSTATKQMLIARARQDKPTQDHADGMKAVTPQRSSAAPVEPDRQKLFDVLPLQFQDGPDYCTVRDAKGKDFALTVQPDILKEMESALRVALVAGQ